MLLLPTNVINIKNDVTAIDSLHNCIINITKESVHVTHLRYNFVSLI